MLGRPTLLSFTTFRFFFTIKFFFIMADHTMTSTPGTQNKVTAESLQAFSAGLRGSLITPDSPDYDKARTIWNATVDKRPDMIVRCAGTADVMHAVKFARENSLLVAIK